MLYTTMVLMSSGSPGLVRGREINDAAKFTREFRGVYRPWVGSGHVAIACDDYPDQGRKYSGILAGLLVDLRARVRKVFRRQRRLRRSVKHGFPPIERWFEGKPHASLGAIPLCFLERSL